jgi:hypothetical protein
MLPYLALPKVSLSDCMIAPTPDPSLKLKRLPANLLINFSRHSMAARWDEHAGTTTVQSHSCLESTGVSYNAESKDAKAVSVLTS